MEKRLIFAITLSMLVVLLWAKLTNKTQLIVTQDVKSSPPVRLAPGEPLITKTDLEPAAASKKVTLEAEASSLTFVEPWAAIEQVIFRGYKDYRFALKNSLAFQETGLSFRKEPSSKDALVFVHADAQKKITKRLHFSNSGYSIELEIKVDNLTTAPLSLRLPLILGTQNYSGQDPFSRYQDIAISSQNKTTHHVPKKDLSFADTKFLALRDRYFCIIIEKEQGAFKANIEKKNNSEFLITLEDSDWTIPPNAQIGHLYKIYLGPQEASLLNKINPDWTNIIYYGFWDLISEVILKILKLLYVIVHNWGLAIIGLALIIYILLFPLTLKQMRSIKEMQELQPKIEELKRLYKDDAQKLNKEVMELYRTHKVNPLGGCLSLIPQLPIFLALYQALMRSPFLRGAEFLWIKDLSEPDKLISFKQNIPFMGNELNILPILMAIGMLVQQKITKMPSTDQKSAEQQKIMTLLMPLLFGVIFYRMPSGLVLYWFVNSMLTLIYQLRANRKR